LPKKIKGYKNKIKEKNKNTRKYKKIQENTRKYKKIQENTRIH